MHTSINHFMLTFLVACTRVYKPLCWSVCRLVGPSVGRLVCWSVGRSVAECLEHATYGDRPCSYFYSRARNSISRFVGRSVSLLVRRLVRRCTRSTQLMAIGLVLSAEQSSYIYIFQHALNLMHYKHN